MANTIFSKIVAGEIPCTKVFENDHVLAFLDINPLAVGHTLVIPKRDVERYEDLTDEEAAELARVVKAVAQSVLRATGVDGYNILQNNGEVSGQEIAHVHFHIIPRNVGDGLGYRWLAKSADPTALKALADKIKTGL